LWRPPAQLVWADAVLLQYIGVDGFVLGWPWIMIANTATRQIRVDELAVAVRWRDTVVTGSWLRTWHHTGVYALRTVVHVDIFCFSARVTMSLLNLMLQRLILVAISHTTSTVTTQLFLLL